MQKFRVDVRVRGEHRDLGLVTMYGATLEIAIGSTLGILSTHVEDGSTVEVVNVGVWCDECSVYHPCTERLVDLHADVGAALSAVAGVN
jgi:hypothetical protein